MENKRKKFNYRTVIISCMCLLLVFSTTSLTGCKKKDKAPENQKLQTNIEVNNEKENIENPVEDNAKNSEDSTIEEKQDVSSENSKIKFIKHQLKKDYEPEFATKLVNSIDNKLGAAIEGKGPDVEEEGIGKIFVKDLSSGEKWALEIVPGEEQNTPKSIEWIDDENIVSIVGLGYGTVSLGGNLYKINVKTGAVSTIYDTNSLKRQVIAAKKVENKLELEILVYDDDELIKTHTEKKIINIQ